MKQSAAKLFGIKPELWDEIKNEPNAKITLSWPIGEDGSFAHHPVTARHFLQLYGTEAHRNIFGDDFWTNALFKNFDPWDGKNYVITDARFGNELAEIKEKGGYTLRVIRGNSLEDLHVSEVLPPLIYIDDILDNNGSYKDLYDQVDNFMATFINATTV